MMKKAAWKRFGISNANIDPCDFERIARFLDEIGPGNFIALLPGPNQAEITLWYWKWPWSATPQPVNPSEPIRGRA